MLLAVVRRALLDDLRVLRGAIEAYAEERDLWLVPDGIANSAGTLALHQAGAIRALIGAALGDAGYVRDREGEFSRRDVPRDDILREIDQAAEDVERTFGRLSEADLGREFPVAMSAVPITVGTFLVRLAMHTSYHNGQIDYHRRLLTNKVG